MSGLLQWLYELSSDGEAAEGVLQFRFATAPARWIMLAGAIVAALIVYNLYRREVAAGSRRWALMTLRFGVIMTALLLFSRPTITLRRSHVEPSVVAVLIDRSQSMAEQDVPSPRPPGSHAPTDLTTASPMPAIAGDLEKSADQWNSRWSAAVGRLTASTGLLKSLLDVHRAEVWTLGSRAVRVADLSSAADITGVHKILTAMDPDDHLSDIDGALDDVLKRLSGRRLAGVLLLSDGRRHGGTAGVPVAQRLGARGLPVVAFGAGSSTPRTDVEVVSLWADDRVFVFDSIEARLHLSLRGILENTELEIEVVEEASGASVARRSVSTGPGDLDWRGSIRFKPAGAGRHRFRVGVRELAAERSTANNWAHVDVDVQEATVAVLYVEDPPRFEYRYLKNLLMRESGIDSSCLLLSATSGFVQEGTRPIDRFPRSIEELGRYDVVVLGDVDPRSDWLSPAQETMLVDFVANLGGGIAFLAGERSMPHRLRRTRLEKLLPVSIGAAGVAPSTDPLIEPFVPRLTADGRQSPILRWFENDEMNNRFLSDLPGWFWTAPVGDARPGAAVLLEHPGNDRIGRVPILALGRYGAGRTMFVGTDDLWRWRQVGEQDAYHAFWLRSLRELARNRRLGPDRPMRIETDRREYGLGQMVNVEVHGTPDAMPAPAELDLVIRDAAGMPIDRVAVRRAESRFLAGSFRASRLGTLEIAADSHGRSEIPSRLITVAAPNGELDMPEADPVYLKDLAEATGGAFYDVSDESVDMARLIPDRSLRIADDLERPLWDTRAMLAAFMLLITAEWIVRKYAGLT